MQLKEFVTMTGMNCRTHYETKLFKLEKNLKVPLEKLIKKTDLSDKYKQIIFTRLAPITEPEATPINSFNTLGKKFGMSASQVQQLTARAFYAICQNNKLNVKDYV